MRDLYWHAKGIVSGQGFDLNLIGNDVDDLSVYHLDDLVDVFGHAEIMGDHDASTTLFVNQIGKCFYDLVGAISV